MTVSPDAPRQEKSSADRASQSQEFAPMMLQSPYSNGFGIKTPDKGVKNDARL